MTIRLRRDLRAPLIAVGLVWLLAGAATTAGDSEPEESFEGKLARVDLALRENPSHVLPQAIESCLRRREHAISLYQIHERVRAIRLLSYCTQLLKISDKRPHDMVVEEETIAEIQARSAREVEQALALEPDIRNGLEIYRSCAGCHTPEGWGLHSGLVPQIAGQHRTVVIKQLADIRAGNREAVLMAPYAAVEVIGGVQAVADVAAYIDTLEISTDVGRGPGDRLDFGKTIYETNCASCHGLTGAGDEQGFVPRIHSQHYDYLMRQFQRIRDGRRHNANPEMRKQIEGFTDAQTSAVLDYVSRLEPPPELQAPPGWKNPDFAQ